jgi:hypothetical protein
MTAIAACRTCGTEPVENARFCHGCGSPVVGVDTHAEFKQVTGYPAARCDPGSTPAVMGGTTQSLLVVCEIGPANYYYRGLRFSDVGSIELANAVRSSDGFDVTNPVDGTRYQVRPTSISITSPGGQVSSEPMIEYAAR